MPTLSKIPSTDKPVAVKPSVTSTRSSGAAKTGAKAIWTALPMKFPMYTVTVKDALAMQEIISHQELLTAGALQVYEVGMVVIFVSHQWLGFSFPDAHFHQFKVLQEALKGLIGNCTLFGV